MRSHFDRSEKSEFKKDKDYSLEDFFKMTIVEFQNINFSYLVFSVNI